MFATNTNPDSKKLDILLIGTGVIGSVYGSQFSLAGHNLWVLAYGTREDALAKNGIQLQDIATRKTEIVKAAIARRSDEREFDLVIVAVRADQLASTFPSLRMLKGNPRILFFGNNPDGHTAIPKDLPGTVQLGFPGIAGALNGEIVEYGHIAQQPTMLEMTSPGISGQIDSVLKSRGFRVGHTAHIDGWLAYHSVFIASISMALLRVDSDAKKLGNNHKLLTLMCRSIEEGFRMLRSQGVKGLPHNLAILHTPLLRPIAVRYWDSIMRSPEGELYFAAHTRHASEEVYTLAAWVLKRAKDSRSIDHLCMLLKPPSGMGM
jgi:2-dehydropantoate 2-reductase